MIIVLLGSFVVWWFFFPFKFKIFLQVKKAFNSVRLGKIVSLYGVFLNCEKSER